MFHHLREFTIQIAGKAQKEPEKISGRVGGGGDADITKYTSHG